MIQTNHWTPESAQAILLAMIAQQYQLYIERHDPRRNMARFYALSIEETLFGVKGERRRRAGQIEAVRTLRHALEVNRSAPWISLVVPDVEVDEISGLVGGLGPRARLIGEAGQPVGTYEIREG